MKNENLEQQLMTLIATDRIEIPISSLSGKLKRGKPKIAHAIELPKSNYVGERVYARTESKDELKARSMKEAVTEFADKYPSHGKVLYGIIAEKRLQKETHMYFGMRDGCRLTSDDYLGVMKNLGFSEQRAEGLYDELMIVSRNIAKKRGNPERSILIGRLEESDEE